MADIKEKCYPDKTMIVNHLTRSLTPTTASTIELRYTGRYKYDSNMDEYSEYLSMQLIFDLAKSPYAATKRLKLEKIPGSPTTIGELRLYVISSNYSMQGNLPGRTSYEPALGQRDDIYFPVGFLETAQTTLQRLADINAPQEIKGRISKEQVHVRVTPALNGNPYSNVLYTHQSRVVVDLQGNKPYLEVTWEDVTPMLRSKTPGPGAFVDNHKDAVFTWNYDGGKSYSGVYNAQTSATLEWKNKGSAEIKRVSIKGDTAQCMIPAGTFPEKGDLEWRVCVTSKFGPTAETAWQEITTTDKLPAAPSGLQPNNIRVDNNTTVTLSWCHESETGTTQSGAMVEYSKNYGSSWQALGNVTGSKQSLEIMANGLPAGAVWWRVKTANSDGDYGPWSDPAQIIVRSAPVAPTIAKVSNSPRPIVEWQSEEQQGYSVKIQADGVIYSTGSKYGGTKRIKCPQYLPEGKAQILVEISNRIGATNHTQIDINISNTDPETLPPGKIILSACAVYGTVKLRWRSSRFVRYYILRDGRPIGMTEKTSYEDRLSAGRPVYQIMGIYGKDEDYYVLSQKVPVSVPIKDTILVDLDTKQTHYLRLHRDSPPTLTRTITAEVEYQKYAGKSLPVPQQAETRTEGLTLEYTVQHGELPSLYQMIGHTLCVKQRDGSATFAVLESINVNLWKRADVALQLTRVDHQEIVDYV